MKKSFHNTGLLTVKKFGHDEKDVFYGINLGWSFDALHQQGIGVIQSALGIPATPTGDRYGVFARKLRWRNIEKLKLFTDRERGFTYLACLPSKNWEGIRPDVLDARMGIWSHDDRYSIQAAWSANAFAVRVSTSEYGEYVGAIVKAVRSNDVLVYLGDGVVLPTGLNVAVMSQMPACFRATIAKLDCDNFQLARMMEANGIDERLREAGFNNLTLIPQFLTPEESSQKKTAYRMHFRLSIWETNPAWYTVEELNQMILEHRRANEKKSA